MSQQQGASITLSDGTPETVIACWRGAWSGYSPGEREEALERLSAAIDHAFNPADRDSDQGSLLEDAVLAAAMYIEVQPCDCTDDGPCPRCIALGRWWNNAVDR